tara:strand:- start:36025 stop:36636 length:612 start_codon:yes stop_codon:yes gene_type:complete
MELFGFLTDLVLDDLMRYLTMASIFFGLCMVQLQSGLSFDSMFSYACRQQRYREVSATITYLCVLSFFIASYFLEEKLLWSLFSEEALADERFAGQLSKPERLIIFYSIKSFSEVVFAFTLALFHRLTSVRLSFIAILVCCFSLVVALVHFARAIDRAVLATNLMDSLYSPSIMAINLTSVVAMAFYVPSLRLAEKRRSTREF